MRIVSLAIDSLLAFILLSLSLEQETKLYDGSSTLVRDEPRSPLPRERRYEDEAVGGAEALGELRSKIARILSRIEAYAATAEGSALLCDWSATMLATIWRLFLTRW